MPNQGMVYYAEYDWLYILVKTDSEADDVQNELQMIVVRDASTTEYVEDDEVLVQRGKFLI